MNPRNIYLLLKVIAKKYILRTRYDERHLLMNSVFDVSSVKIEMDGRALVLPHGGHFLTGLIMDIFVCNQYDLSEQNVRGKVIVDAGASLGVFSILCASLGARKVYAFEPVKGTYDLLKKNIAANNLQGTILPINMALGQERFTAQIRSDYSGDASASLVLKKDGGAAKSQDVQVVPLDEFLKGERVDLVKMDVEGFEKNVILGAKETIRAYKPILTLSAYHKPEDKEALPKAILGIRDDYKIRLNHFQEEDFYCE